MKYEAITVLLPVSCELFLISAKFLIYYCLSVILLLK